MNEVFLSSECIADGTVRYHDGPIAFQPNWFFNEAQSDFWKTIKDLKDVDHLYEKNGKIYAQGLRRTTDVEVGPAQMIKTPEQGISSTNFAK